VQCGAGIVSACNDWLDICLGTGVFAECDHLFVQCGAGNEGACEEWDEVCGKEDDGNEEGGKKEAVGCIFRGSNSEQSCYTRDGVGFKCSGTEKCVAYVFGDKGYDLNWYSTCGGYAHTVIDGKDDYIEFYCGSDEEYTTEKYRRAHWVCEDDDEIVEEGGETSCKSEATWKFYAIEYCKENSQSKELDDFEAYESCGKDIILKPKEESIEIIGETEEANYLCQGCELNKKCYPYGYRKSEKFCADTGSFVEQSKGNAVCENNFECFSNLCIDSQCVSQGLFQKIISWFKNLFG